MKDRIKRIMEKVNLNAAEFADEININPQTFNAAINRNHTVNTRIVQAILSHYEDINAEWLLIGKGMMMKKDKAYLEPGLFDESEKFEDNPPTASENRKEMGAKRPEKEAKKSVNQQLIGDIISSKKIDRIVIFFSDNTFTTLKPEE